MYRQRSAGYISAVSTPISARNGLFFRIFRDLQDFHTFAPLQNQVFGTSMCCVVSNKLPLGHSTGHFRAAQADGGAHYQLAAGGPELAADVHPREHPRGRYGLQLCFF